MRTFVKKKFVFILLSIIFVLTVMTGCINQGTNNPGVTPDPQGTAAPTDIVDNTPVKITDIQKDKIDKFSNKSGDIKFKETRKSTKTGVKQTVFEDDKYKYTFSDNGNVSISDKDVVKDIKVKQTTKLTEAAKVALAQAQQIAPVTKGCEYRVIEQKLLNPTLPDRSVYFIVFQEFTDKDVFTGSAFTFIVNKAGAVLNMNYNKGDAAVALSQTAKITKTQAISKTKDFVMKTYNLVVVKILSSGLVVYKGKLAWAIDFYLKNGSFRYRHKVDAITGGVLSDAIGELRKMMNPAASASPAP